MDLDINKKDLLNFLLNNDFFVASYQRDYNWDDNLIEILISDLFFDLEKYIDNSAERINNYLGNFLVFKNSNNRLEIIDGQQRITTFFLIIKVLKEKFDFLKREIDFNRDFDTRDLDKKLADFGEAKIQFENTRQQTMWTNFWTSSDKKLKYWKAYSKIKIEIEKNLKYLEEKNNNWNSSQSEIISLFFNQILKKIEIGILTINNEWIKIDVFEKMNSNKIDLSEWDLLKGYYSNYLITNSNSINKSISDLDEDKLINLNDDCKTIIEKLEKNNNYWIYRGSSKKFNSFFFELIEFYVKSIIDSKKLKIKNIKNKYSNSKGINIKNDLKKIKENLKKLEAKSSSEILTLITLMNILELKTISKHTFFMYFKFIENWSERDTYEIKILFLWTFLNILIMNKRSNTYQAKLIKFFKNKSENNDDYLIDFEQIKNDLQENIIDLNDSKWKLENNLAFKDATKVIFVLWVISKEQNKNVFKLENFGIINKTSVDDNDMNIDIYYFSKGRKQNSKDIKKNKIIEEINYFNLEYNNNQELNELIKINEMIIKNINEPDIRLYKKEIEDILRREINSFWNLLNQ